MNSGQESVAEKLLGVWNGGGSEAEKRVLSYTSRSSTKNHTGQNSGFVALASAGVFKGHTTSMRSGHLF